MTPGQAPNAERPRHEPEEIESDEEGVWPRHEPELLREPLVEAGRELFPDVSGLNEQGEEGDPGRGPKLGAIRPG